MKNLLVLLLCLMSYPVYATCAINNLNACSVAELDRASIQSSFKNSETTLPSYADNQWPSSAVNTNPDRAVDKTRDFGAQSSDYSYNTNCQFGICNEGGAAILFDDRLPR